MTRNRLSTSHYAYSFIQVVHTDFINVFHTEYSAFKTLNKISEEQAAATLTLALISKEKSKKKRQKRKVWVKPWLKRKENYGVYETLLTELRLKDKFNYSKKSMMFQEFPFLSSSLK